MSFTQSSIPNNLTSVNFITDLSGDNGIATQSFFSWSVDHNFSSSITAIYKASSGCWWVGISSGYIYVFSNSNFTNPPLFTYDINLAVGSNVVNVFYESNGFMFVGGEFAGLVAQPSQPQFSLMRFSGAGTTSPVFDPIFNNSSGQRGFSGQIYAITSDNSNLYVGGLFATTFFTPATLYNLCIIGNAFGSSGSQTYTNDSNNFSTNGVVYAMYSYNNSGTQNIYVGGNFTNVANGSQTQSISYGAVYSVGWTTTPFSTIGAGNFNSLIASFAPAVDGVSLLFTGAFSFTEGGQLIQYGGYSTLASPLTNVKSFNISGIGASSLVRNCIGVNAPGYNFFITDNRQVWFGTDSNSWKDGGIAFTSGTPSGIVYDSASNFVAMSIGFSVRKGYPASYLYNSTDFGASWSLPSNGSGSVPNVLFSSNSLSGLNGVAAGLQSFDPVVFFTTNVDNWAQSTQPPLPPFATNSILVSIFDSYALLAINSTNNSDYQVYHSGDGGNNWVLGITEPLSSTPRKVKNVAVSSSSMIVVVTQSTDTKIWYSITNGSTWASSSQSLITNPSLSSSGANSVLCGEIGGNGYILYSSNNGANWNTPTLALGLTLTSNITKIVSIDGNNVAMIGGINETGTTAFIWYSADGGANWTNSDFVLANPLSFTGILVSGNIGLASINDVNNNGYLYYSTDQGDSWLGVASGVLNNTNISGVSLSGNKGVAGTNNDIYYTITPLCYEANTLILITENEEEVYKKVSELKVGDLVKTYKQGYKKIKLFRSFKYKPFDINNDLNLLYKHKENGVIVTGGHSILVDELTEQEKLNNLKHYGFNQTIEDKKLLLACSSDKFEKIVDYREEYHLCHFSLESDDPKEHFGVYMTDGILSESCPEKALLKIMF